MITDFSLQTMIDALPSEVMIVDESATVKFVSRVMKKNDWCVDLVGSSFFGFLNLLDAVENEVESYFNADARQADKQFQISLVNSAGECLHYSIIINPVLHAHVADSNCFIITFVKIDSSDIIVRSCRNVQHQYLEMIFSHISEAVFLAPILESGEVGDFIVANAEACRRLGYSEAELLSLTSCHLNAAANLERIKSYGDTLKKKGALTFESIHLSKEGGHIPVEIFAKIIQCDKKNYVLSVAKDLREVKKSENSQALLGRLMDYSGNEIYVVDSESLNIKMVNEGALKNLGIDKAELEKYKFSDLLVDTSAEQFIAFSCELFEGESNQLIYESQFRRVNGSLYPVEVRLQLSLSEVPPLLLANVQDISERKKIERRLTYLASYDALTKLPNKALFMDRLFVAMEAVKRQDKLIAVLFIDLDGFKQVNDTHGHDVGDLLVREVAKRLVKCTRKSDTVSRFGGDEFTIILNNINTVSGVDTVLKKIMKNISESFLLDGREILTTPSIGVTLYPFNDKDDGNELLRQADVAMYQAKNLGKRSWVYYSSQLSLNESRRNEVESAARCALKRKELELYFQPRVDLRDNSIVGAEVLLRWQKSKLGFISPVEFIPLMEKIGVMVDVGEWVLRESCIQLRKWMDQGHDFRISVNVSAKQFDGGLLHELVARVLEETNVPPNRLEIEITEGLLIDQSDDAIVSLEKISATGVSISLDDFGTGYSSLSYLKQFPIDVLKIDRSFVMDLQDNKDSLVIVEAIVGLAKNLGLSVTAEGIEEKWHADFLTERGCDEGQGYYFARPMPKEEMQQILEDSRTMALPISKGC